jgi:Fic family protein
MQAADFSRDMPGALVPTVGGLLAFMPAPLPPHFNWTIELASAVSAADLALGKLAGVGQDLSNPQLFIRPFRSREAELSSKIEGTQASTGDLLLFEADERSVEKAVPDVREVANYIRALEYGLERVNDLPLSLRLIREMHGILMDGVRGQTNTPGEFRRNQVHIGPDKTHIEDATFVPPPPSHLGPALDAFEKYLHAQSDLPPVARWALIHYQFEAMHPFMDGNGRIGRLLIMLLLCLDRILPYPLLYLSAYFERTKAAYYDKLLQVSRQGSWEDWITYFARGVALQAADAADQAQRLKQLQADYLARVRTPGASALAPKLIEYLFEEPALTISRVGAALDITYPAAQGHVNRLVDLGILRLATPHRKRNRLYVADEILSTGYNAQIKEI